MTNALDAATEFSIGGWLRLDSTVAGNMAVVSRMSSGSRNGFLFYLAAAADNDLIVIAADGSAERLRLDSGITMRDDTWRHVGAVLKKGNGTTSELFVSGTSAVTANASADWAFTAATDDLRWGEPADSFWDGMGGTGAGLAAWGAWNVALGAAEWVSLAKGFHPTQIRPASLIDAWDFYGNASPEPGWKGSTAALTSGLTHTSYAPNVMRPRGPHVRPARYTVVTTAARAAMNYRRRRI